MNNITVSIVTPSYNQASFLEATILSVLNQTYPHIEYVIIDGGSDDGSVEIIQKYASRLTYWQSKKDGGQADAINIGLGYCTGKLFAYLNSDDLLEPDAVRAIAEAYQKDPGYAIYYGKCTNIDGSGTPLGPALGGITGYDKLLKHTMLPDIHQPACFFNYALIERSPVFNPLLSYGMDYELILFLMKKHQVLFIDQPIARFRYHNDSKTMAQSNRMYREKMKIQRMYGKNNQLLWIWRYAKYMVKNELLERIIPPLKKPPMNR